MKPPKKSVRNLFFAQIPDKKGVNYKKACKRDECERCGHSKYNKMIGEALHYRSLPKWDQNVN